MFAIPNQTEMSTVFHGNDNRPAPTTHLGMYLADVRTAFELRDFAYALPVFMFKFLPSVRRNK